MEIDIYEYMISIKNIKSPGNDELKKEFCQTLWKHFKDVYLNSLQESERLKYLCASEQQAVIKLLENLVKICS